MRDLATKIDNTSTLPAAEFNSDQNELENAVTGAGIALDSASGPDSDLNMLGKAMATYGLTMAYSDTGVADAYALTRSGASLQTVAAYTDKLTIVFKASNTNTGTSTINVSTLGVKSLTNPDGSALSAGDIESGNYYIVIYNLSADRFELQSFGGGSSAAVDVIYDNSTSGLTASDVQAAIDEVVADLANYLQLSDYTDSFASNGYSILPNGLIFQWGQASLSSGVSNKTVTFPVTFSNACLGGNVTVNSNSLTATYNPMFYINNTSSCNLRNTDGKAVNVFWFAYGY